jgi:hypothetical protein
MSLGRAKQSHHSFIEICSRLIMNAAARQWLIGLGKISSGLAGGRHVLRAGLL